MVFVIHSSTLEKAIFWRTELTSLATTNHRNTRHWQRQLVCLRNTKRRTRVRRRQSSSLSSTTKTLAVSAERAGRLFTHATLNISSTASGTIQPASRCAYIRSGFQTSKRCWTFTRSSIRHRCRSSNSLSLVSARRGRLLIKWIHIWYINTHLLYTSYIIYKPFTANPRWWNGM